MAADLLHLPVFDSLSPPGGRIPREGACCLLHLTGAGLNGRSSLSPSRLAFLLEHESNLARLTDHSVAALCSRYDRLTHAEDIRTHAALARRSVSFRILLQANPTLYLPNMVKDTMREQSPSSGYSDEHMSLGRYIATRIPSLKPPLRPIPNPFKTLALLNTQQWLFFLVAFFAWT